MSARIPGATATLCALAAAVLAAPPAMPPADDDGGAKVPGILFTPTSSINYAAADILTVPETERSYIRYLSLYWLPEKDLPDYTRVVTFVLNSLSRNSILIPSVTVPGSGNRLLRVNLHDYRISSDAFDTLISTGSGFSPIPESYFYLNIAEAVTTEEYTGRLSQTPATDPADGRQYLDYLKRPLFWDGRSGDIARDQRGVPYSVDGRQLFLGAVDRVQAKPKTERRNRLALAPWLPKEKALALATAAHTQYPIARADWFLFAATIEPQYHLLLGLDETLGSFLKLAVAEEELADREGVQTRGAVLHSEVALHNRALERTPTILRYGKGYYWASFDFNRSDNQDDVLQDLLANKPDAQELIATLRNGLQAYFVVDGKGKRLDKAAADVAIDSRTTLRDKQVWTARNCVTCHATGIIPVEDEVRLHATGKIALGLQALKEKDERAAQRIVDRYFAVTLDELVKQDQATYESAVKSCNGLTGAANALLLQKLLSDYYDRPVLLADMARDTGYDVQVLRGVIERGVALDHALVGAIQDPPRRQRRDQWESSGISSIFPQLLAVPVKEK